MVRYVFIPYVIKQTVSAGGPSYFYFQFTLCWQKRVFQNAQVFFSLISNEDYKKTPIKHFSISIITGLWCKIIDKNFQKTKVYEIKRNKNHKYEYFGHHINSPESESTSKLHQKQANNSRNETFKVKKYLFKNFGREIPL